jgi:hypothetical protein
MIETRRISASTITAEILMNSKVVDDKLGNNFSQKKYLSKHTTCF